MKNHVFSKMYSIFFHLQYLRVDFAQPIEDVISVMQSEWNLFGPRSERDVTERGLIGPTFIVSILGSSRINEIRPRYSLQYFQTVHRMFQFIEHMGNFPKFL